MHDIPEPTIPSSSSSSRTRTSGQNPLPRLSKIDGYSYYIEDDYFESNSELSGRSNDTFKFNRPTFASCLEKRQQKCSSSVSASSKISNSCDYYDSIPWDGKDLNQSNSNGKHNIDDLLEELASESTDGESGNESNDETLEQYYARIKSGIKNDAGKLRKNFGAGSKIERKASDDMAVDEKEEQEPKQQGLSTADEIMAGADDNNEQTNDSTEPTNVDPKTKKQQQDDQEYYELYHNSQFGLSDNLYDNELDDQDEKYVEDNNLKKVKNSDAILSCGKCFSIFTYDCQRHSKYENQFRAMFVQSENVKIVPDKIVKFRKKEVGRDGKRRRVNKKSLKKRQGSGEQEQEQEVTSVESPNQDSLLSPVLSPPTATTSKDLTSPETKSIPIKKAEKNSEKINQFSTKSSSTSKNVEIDDMNDVPLTSPKNSPKKSKNSNKSDDFGDPALYDHYFQVVCGDCGAEIAYYDREEVYHFYNVIAS